MNINSNPENFHKVTQLFSALAILDTNAHNSSSAAIGGFVGNAIVVQSTLNQTVSIQVQVSQDGTNFANVGSAQSVTASSNAAFGSDVIAALGQPYEYVRLVATCSVAPASGALTANIGSRAR